VNNTERSEEMVAPREINLLDYWIIILKRKWLIAGITLMVLTSIGVKTFTTKPTYTAQAMLLIEKESNILSFSDIFQIESFQQDYFQTQYALLKSRSLIDRTIETLKLYENPDFVGKKATNGKTPDKNDPVFRSRLIDAVLGGLGVSPVRQTRLVQVSFKAGNPKLAADVANTILDSFINLNIESRFSATEQATEFLTMQIASLRSEIERKERDLQASGVEKNIVALSDKETTVIDKLSELNKALTAAQIEKINKESYYNEIKNASPEYIPDAILNPLIQRLKEDYGKLSRDYAKKQEIYQPNYPELLRLKNELESAKKSLESETQNLIKGAYSDYQAALKKAQSLEGAFNKQKQESIQLNSNAISYNSAKIELDNRKALLDSLLKRESETGVSARLRGLRTSNIKVVDRAEVPKNPSAPKKKMNMILGLFLGLMGGLGLAFLLDYMDNSVKGGDDVEKCTHLPTLGIIPEFDPNKSKSGYGYGYGYGYNKPKSKSGIPDVGGDADKESAPAKRKIGVAAEPALKSIDLIAQISPKSSFSESYRTIRTALLLSTATPGGKTFVLTSPLPAEGKSSTIANLAVTLAQTNRKVLILDADLRKPRQHKIFKIKNLNGMTNYLTSGLEMKELIKPTNIPNLFLINAGPVPPNPAELLGSDKMGHILSTFKGAFDFILIDTPPVLAVTDAMVLGPIIDGIILLVWGGKTAREALKRAKERLDLMNVKTIGVVINRLNIKEHSYYYKHHYYHYYEEA